MAPALEHTETLQSRLLTELRAAVVEACAGAVDCSLRTLERHVVWNADRYPLLAQAQIEGSLRSLALLHLAVRKHKERVYVGAKA